MDDDFAAVIEQNIFVDGAVVFDCQVVAEGEFHSVKNFHVTAAMLENVAGKHGAHRMPQPVVQAHGRPVIHHPEPDQWLALAILCGIRISVVFRLQA